MTGHTILFLLICFSCFLSASRAHQDTFLFDREICTGLGDRVGTMLTLASLARIQNARVIFWWCDDPARIYPRIHPHIPRWHGYNYSLTDFKKRFRVPNEIILVEWITPSHKQFPLVQWTNMPIPAEHGSDSVYTIAWKTTRLSPASHQVSAESFRHSYQTVARLFARTPPISTSYIVVHLRGPDNNTYSQSPHSWDDLDLYCTGKVLKKLITLNVTMHIISNNVQWANELLARRLPVNTHKDNSTVYDDFSLLLGAAAIVQHAWGGWSSYSSVPALASGVPIINTFRGQPHRYNLFQTQGGLPGEMYQCSQLFRYIDAVKHVLTKTEN